jgi:hypothetical protein
MRTTIIKTAKPMLFATMVAASGIALSPFAFDVPAMARGGGGDGGGGGGGDGASSGGGDHTGIYAVMQADAARGSTVPQPPRGRTVAERGDHGGTGCGTRNIRVVYTASGEPVRYMCMPTR